MNRGSATLSHCCGKLGIHRKKGFFAQYQINSCHYWQGVVEGDSLSQFRRIRNLSDYMKEQCGKYYSKKCMDYLLESITIAERGPLISLFLVGALKSENKQTIEFLFTYEEAREELRKTAGDGDWQEDDGEYYEFSYWLISRGFFNPSEKEWEQMKTQAPLLYANLSSDV